MEFGSFCRVQTKYTAPKLNTERDKKNPKGLRAKTGVSEHVVLDHVLSVYVAGCVAGWDVFTAANKGRLLFFF